MKITMSYQFEEEELIPFLKDVGKWGRVSELTAYERLNSGVKAKKEKYYNLIETLLTQNEELSTMAIHRRVVQTIKSSYKTTVRRLSEMAARGKVVCTLDRTCGQKAIWRLI